MIVKRDAIMTCAIANLYLINYSHKKEHHKIVHSTQTPMRVCFVYFLVSSMCWCVACGSSRKWKHFKGHFSNTNELENVLSYSHDIPTEAGFAFIHYPISNSNEIQGHFPLQYWSSWLTEKRGHHNFYCISVTSTYTVCTVFYV